MGTAPRAMRGGVLGAVTVHFPALLSLRGRHFGSPRPLGFLRRGGGLGSVRVFICEVLILGCRAWAILSRPPHFAHVLLLLHGLPCGSEGFCAGRVEKRLETVDHLYWWTRLELSAAAFTVATACYKVSRGTEDGWARFGGVSEKRDVATWGQRVWLVVNPLN